MFYISKGLLFFLVLISSLNCYGQYSDADLLRFKEIVESFSPMPEKPDVETPGYQGAKFTFYHKLRNLSDYTKYFDPNNKNFFYSEVPGFGPDPAVRLNNMRRIYEALLADYEELKNDPKFEEYKFKRPLYIYGETAPIVELFPKKTMRLLNFTEMTTTQFLAEVNVKQYLERVTEQQRDRRRSTTFFFTEFRTADYKPLESIYSLTMPGSRARALLEADLLNTSEELKRIQSELTTLVDWLVEGDGVEFDNVNDLYRRWNQVDMDLKDVGYKHELNNNMIDSALRYGNDVNYDREKNFQLFSDIELEVRQLAKSLVALHGEVDRIATSRESADGGSEGYRSNQERTVLSDPYNDIPNLFRDHEQRRVYKIHGIGVPDELIGRYGGTDGLYTVYKEALMRQYLFAVGFLISKAFDSREVRGDLFSRGLQNFRYQLAKVKKEKRNEARIEGATQLTAVQENLHFDVEVSVSKKDFLTRSAHKSGQEAEDRLWRVFFEEAAEVIDKRNKSNSTSAVLIKATQSQKSCKKIFRL